MKIINAYIVKKLHEYFRTLEVTALRITDRNMKTLIYSIILDLKVTET